MHGATEITDSNLDKVTGGMISITSIRLPTPIVRPTGPSGPGPASGGGDLGTSKPSAGFEPNTVHFPCR